MNADIALYWIQDGLQTALVIIAPLLGAALVVGLLVSLFQAVTSIQEMTLTFIPKITTVGLILLMLAPWMLQLLVDFTTHVFQFIPNLAR